MDQEKKISFVVSSCDKYSDLWDIFFSCFFKYWPDCPYEIYLISNFKTFESERVKTIKLGEDKDYGSNLKKISQNIPTDWFVFWIDDAILSDKINTNFIKKILNLAQKKNAGSCLLIPTYPVAYSKEKDDLIGPIPKFVKYRAAIGCCLYHKKTFNKLILEGKDIWEHDKNNAPNNFEDKFYALTTNLKKPLFPHAHGVVKGKWCRPFIKFLKKEGFEKLIPKRKKETLTSYFYGKIYYLRLNLYKFFKLHWYI